MLAEHKTSVKQPQMMVFLPHFDTVIFMIFSSDCFHLQIILIYAKIKYDYFWLRNKEW